MSMISSVSSDEPATFVVNESLMLPVASETLIKGHNIWRVQAFLIGV